MPKYELREQGYVFDTVDAASAEAALEEADEPDRSAYDGGGETTGTIYVEWHAVNADDDSDRASKTFVLDAPEPECTHANGHDWQSPIELVGGVKENPGVVGHGGGVFITEACARCGCKRVTDTWAQDPTNGTQGHTTVTYEPDAYDVDSDEAPDSERTQRADHDLDEEKDRRVRGEG
jgi:hypothetical protein